MLFFLVVGCAAVSELDKDPSNEPDFENTAVDFDSITVGIHESFARYLAEDPSNQAVIIEFTNDASPLFGEAYTDPNFNTTIHRLSNLNISNHFYSQLQAFSHDNTYVLMMEGDTENTVDILVKRLVDMEVVFRFDDLAAYTSARWHPSNFATLVHYDSNLDPLVHVQYTDVSTGETETIFTFPSEYVDVLATPSSEELSRDGKWMAGMVLKNDGNAAIFSLNLESRSLGASIDFDQLYAGPCTPDPQYGPLDPDWVGVSPLGTYLMVQWAASGTNRCEGLESYDITTGEYLGHVTAEHPHSDMQVLSDGVTEVLVSGELAGPSSTQTYVNGQEGSDLDEYYFALSYRELPGQLGGESPPNYLYTTDWIFEHVSCRGPFGYCLVTAYDNAQNGFYDPLEGELFILKLDGTGLIRLAHHHASGSGYWEQPRASMSNDGRYVIFDSDWDLSGVNTAAYMIDLLAQ